MNGHEENKDERFTRLAADCMDESTTQRMLKAFCSHISPQMQSLFMPQIQQLKVRPEYKWSGVGNVFRIDSNEACGWLWVYVPFEGCLISRMSWLALASFSLEERPSQDYVCISTMQTQELALMGEIWERAGTFPSHAYRDEKNLEVLAQGMPYVTLSFPYPAGMYQFDIDEGTVYASTAICLTKEYLHDIAQHFSELSDTIQLLVEHPLTLNENKQVKGLLAHLMPSRFSRRTPQVDAYMQVLNMLSALAAGDACILQPNADIPSLLTAPHHTSTKQFSCAVLRHLQESLSCPPSLNELARIFHVGRTTLCTQFKEEQGESIGEALTKLRIKKIEEGLLCGKTLHQIASELGYASDSSVRSIFIKQTGMSPRSWLKQQGV